MSWSYNWGIAVLKIVAAYWVVCNHFGAHPAWSWMCAYAVPVFMMLAFMLGRRLWQSNEPRALWERVKRLLIPFIAWSLLYWLVSVLTVGVGFKSLVGQLAFGHTVCVPLYFYVLLIWFTISVWMVSQIVKIRYLRWLVGALVVLGCLVLQYWDINEQLISRLPPVLSSGQYPLGRVAELFPAALIGLAMPQVMQSELVKKHRMIVAGLGGVFFVASYWIGLFLTPHGGFHYQGVHLLVGSAGLVTVSTLLGETVVLPAEVADVVKFLAAPLMGVYCVHMMVGRSFSCGARGALVSLGVYVVSFIAACVLSKTRFKVLVV